MICMIKKDQVELVPNIRVWFKKKKKEKKSHGNCEAGRDLLCYWLSSCVCHPANNIWSQSVAFELHFVLVNKYFSVFDYVFDLTGLNLKAALIYTYKQAINKCLQTSDRFTNYLLLLKTHLYHLTSFTKTLSEEQLLNYSGLISTSVTSYGLSMCGVTDGVKKSLFKCWRKCNSGPWWFKQLHEKRRLR